MFSSNQQHTLFNAHHQPQAPTLGNFSITGVPAPLPAPAFNLGVDLRMPNTTANLMASMPTLPMPVVMPNINIIPETAKPAGMGLITGTIKAVSPLVSPVELPPALKTTGLVLSAAHTGRNLAHNIDAALDTGQTTAEAIVCQTAKTVTEELSGKVMKGAIVGGIPAYLTMAVVNPPLAATVPLVAPLLPPAYAGAGLAAQVAGNAAEAACHQGFNLARQLSKGGTTP